MIKTYVTKRPNYFIFLKLPFLGLLLLDLGLEVSYFLSNLGYLLGKSNGGLVSFGRRGNALFDPGPSRRPQDLPRPSTEMRLRNAQAEIREFPS